MKRARVWIIVVIVAVVAAAAWYFYSKKETPKTTYRFGVVDRGDVVISISATGSLSADTTVQVGTQVSGTIQKLFADFNSQVTKGQLLALLDPTFLQAAVDQQGANKDRAQATVNDAQRTFKRTKELFDKGLVSQADLDASTTSLETAQAGLRQAQASLHQAEVNLKYATITAPISGVIVSRNVDVGQTVAASLSAPTLFSIANDLRRMQVQASVDEADIGSVKVGQNVTFRVDAYPDDVFPGTVREIRLAPVVSSNVVTYTVVINVQNQDLKLLPGMTATVTIEVAKAEDVLRVPIQALKFMPAEFANGGWRGMRGGDSTRSRSQGDSSRAAMGRGMGGAQAATPDSGGGQMRRRFDPKTHGRVWILENGAPRPVPFEKGIQNTSHVAIIESQLKEGDSVIVGTNGVNAAATTQQGTNPFMPRFPGGGGQRPGGR